MSPPWSSALAGALQRDRTRLLVAFTESRARLRATTTDGFPGGIAERAEALEQTERDYVAIVEAGAEAGQLEAMLATADRETTQREGDQARLVIAQMSELADAVFARVPPDS